MTYRPVIAGDAGIYPELAVAPPLPAAGVAFRDDTWGTTIYRVTDAVNAPNGSSVNSDASDSQFNADGTRFYCNLGPGIGYAIFGITGTPPAGLTLTNLGAVGASLTLDGAQWDWTDPTLLYVMGQDYILRTVVMPAMTVTTLHDFTTDLPAHTGYSSTRVLLHPTGQYVGAMLSTFGVQDEDDYVVIWDKTTNQTVRVFSSEARFGAGQYLHAAEFDNSGEYLQLTLVGSPVAYFYHWRDDTLSTGITAPGAPDIYNTHSGPGWEYFINGTANSSQDPDVVIRQAATPHTFATLLLLPKKNAQRDWYTDAHNTRVLPPTLNTPTGPLYTITSTYGAHTGWTATPGHPKVYQLDSFYTLGGLYNQPPDTCWFNGVHVPKAQQIPTRANRWWFDAATNRVYLRAPGSVDLTLAANARKAYVFDWRPLMNEIYSLETINGTVTWRRFAHTYSHPQEASDFYAESGANPSNDGRYVLFASRWGGSSRIDVFLMVPPLPPSVTILPNKTHRAGACA